MTKTHAMIPKAKVAIYYGPIYPIVNEDNEKVNEIEKKNKK